MDERDSDSKLIVDPPFDSEIDPSSILSLSLFGDEAILITRDYKIKILYKRNNCPVKRLLPIKHDDFTEFEIKDDQNNVYYPISAALLCTCIFCIASEVKNGSKTKLIYFNSFTDERLQKKFLNTGDSFPVSLYTYFSSAAAIDVREAVLFVPSGIFMDPYELIEQQFLPDDERAVDIALAPDLIYVLSFNGKLFLKQKMVVF